MCYGTLPDDARSSVDVALFLNDISVVTMEHKNNLTGQRTELHNGGANADDDGNE